MTDIYYHNGGDKVKVETITFTELESETRPFASITLELEDGHKVILGYFKEED